jgi:hypothetical protein
VSSVCENHGPLLWVHQCVNHRDESTRWKIGEQNLGSSVDSLLEDVRKFSTSNLLSDDATVVIVEAGQ